jgi:hypothetical protein
VVLHVNVWFEAMVPMPMCRLILLTRHCPTGGLFHFPFPSSSRGTRGVVRVGSSSIEADIFSRLMVFTTVYAGV